MTTMTLRHFPIRSSLALALLGALAPAAYADDNADSLSATELDTIEVKADVARGYHADASQIDSFGSFGHAALQDTPASISVITRDQLDDRQPQSLSELARSDAALGDNYAPVGYYQNLMIRGFALDLATGYRQNQLTLAGEQMLALEDKERVEILKGLGGLEAGIVSPGGLVNLVSKRPAKVRRAQFGVDNDGANTVAVDVGAWLSPKVGVRMNAAHGKLDSWIDHADGRRHFMALAADWKLGDDTTLRFDGNWHDTAQRSASGFQLLGGTTVPENIDRTQLLGYQPWQDPVKILARNASVRLDSRVAEHWTMQIALGHSRAVIDDNVAYAYGCFYAPECATGEVPGNYFAPNGDYDIYDYRSPNDSRRNDELRVALNGQFDTGTINHELSLGASAFRRTIDRSPYVYDYVGTGNIHDGAPPVFAPSPNQPGTPVRRLDSRQQAAFALDRMHLGERWQLITGLRQVRLKEHAWKSSGRLIRTTRTTRNLPQVALLWQPSTQITAYASWSQSLSLGDEAPYWTSNDGEFLAPRLARQQELGLKLSPRTDLNAGIAVYRLSQPFQFAQPDTSAAGFTFVEQGQQRHQGVELWAAGQLSDTLRWNTSINLIRARAQDSLTSSYEGHQLVNIPSRRAAVYLDWTLPGSANTAVLFGGRAASANPATPNGLTQVAGYAVFDIGLRHASQWGEHAMIWRLNLDNVFNRFYWRDTGSSGGDNFLFPGAQRQARLSLSFDF